MFQVGLAAGRGDDAVIGADKVIKYTKTSEPQVEVGM
jgi:hypothetical protein